MKFLTLEQGQIGATDGTTVVDLQQAADLLESFFRARTLRELIEQGADAAAAWLLFQQALEVNRACRPLAEVKPLAPIPCPRRNIFCLGKNYLEHAKEIFQKVDQGGTVPEKPIFFTKATTCVIGTGVPIPSHSNLTAMLDYEAELAVIIGKGGRDIPKENAWRHIFGYTAFNDVSARDLQKDHLQWFRGKSLDGFAPMGPLVVHRSAMPPPEEIEIQSWVNGELRQQAKFSQLIFDIPTIIENLSAGMTLLPGDIIATGTPAAVGMGFNPPRYLKVGDEVVVGVSGAGLLINRVML